MDVTLVWMVVLGLAVGAYGTIIGAGGGFLLVPILLIVFPDYGPEEVTSISLAVVWANATSGSIAYARARRIDYVTGALFAIASVPGVVAGAFAVHYVPARLFQTLFGALLLGVVAVLVTQAEAKTVRQPLAAGPGVLVRNFTGERGVTYRYAFRIWQGVVLSLGVGFISSLFGIGGGIIHVPAMIVLFRIPVSFAVATSQFVLVWMAGGGSIVHLANGTLAGEALGRAVALGAGAVVGAQIGAAVSQRISGGTVLRLLVLALVALSVRLLLKGAFGI